MNPFPLPPLAGAGLLARGLKSIVAVVALATGLTLSAGNISGTYGARGVKVAGAVGEGAAEVSLPALLHLEFNSELGLAQHAGADVVVIEEGPRWVEIRVMDREGQQTWRTHWNEGQGFSRSGAIRQLSVASPRRGEAAVVFVLENIEGDRLLRVEAVRMAATNFGPVPESLGTFIFYRAP
jgi:hypothetical protein